MVIIMEKQSLFVMSTLKDTNELYAVTGAILAKDIIEKANGLLEKARSTSEKYENIFWKCSFNSDERKIVKSSLPPITFPEIKPGLNFSNMLKGIFPSHRL